MRAQGSDHGLRNYCCHGTNGRVDRRRAHQRSTTTIVIESVHYIIVIVYKLRRYESRLLFHNHNRRSTVASQRWKWNQALSFKYFKFAIFSQSNPPPTQEGEAYYDEDIEHIKNEYEPGVFEFGELVPDSAEGQFCSSCFKRTFCLGGIRPDAIVWIG